MKPSGLRFDKTATIYRSEKFSCIEALSGVSALAYREDNGHRIYLEAEATNKAFGRALLAALDRSRLVDPSSEREFYNPGRATRVYEEWQQEFMARYGYKSRRAALTSLDWCSAWISEGRISIQPHRRYTPGSWRSLPPEKTVVVPATEDVETVGAALRLALDRCE